MSKTTAHLKNYRQSPRKVRLVADMVRGKRVEDALTELTFVPKRAAGPIQKLLASALSNAKNLSIPTENLIVKDIQVDGGPTLFRRMPRARGSSYVIRKRTSHLSITLEEATNKKQPTTNKKKKVVSGESSVVS